MAVLGSSQPEVRDRAMCTAIKSGALKVGLSTVEAVCGVFPVSQALAVLARGARAPSGNRKPNRDIINVIKGQRLVDGGEFDPSAAVRETNRALKTAKRSRSALYWDEIRRKICGLCTPLPINSAYIDVTANSTSPKPLPKRAR